MTWMTGMRSHRWILAVLISTVVTTGCGPSEKDLKIQDLSAENDQLKTDIAERDRQLNDTLVRENDARETIDELNQEMAALHADREKIKDVEGWVSTPTFDMISISDAVLFASGKAGLSTTGRSRLAQVASAIRSRYADRDIYIFGHTDAQPIRKSKWKDNWQLGAERSLTVARALSNLGIAREQIIAASCGEYRPIASGPGAANQSRNRRVEVYAVQRGASESTAFQTYPDN